MVHLLEKYNHLPFDNISKITVSHSRGHSTSEGTKKNKKKNTTAGIRWWSPTQLLARRRVI